jgi:hypothetical protein
MTDGTGATDEPAPVGEVRVEGVVHTYGTGVTVTVEA